MKISKIQNCFCESHLKDFSQVEIAALRLKLFSLSPSVSTKEAQKRVMNFGTVQEKLTVFMETSYTLRAAWWGCGKCSKPFGTSPQCTVSAWQICVARFSLFCKLISHLCERLSGRRLAENANIINKWRIFLAKLWGDFVLLSFWIWLRNMRS